MLVRLLKGVTMPNSGESRLFLLLNCTDSCVLRCLQVQAALLDVNSKVLKKLILRDEQGRAHIASVQRELQQGYLTALDDPTTQHQSVHSVRAAGCFQAGLFQQVQP